jgi:hypothetical protein
MLILKYRQYNQLRYTIKIGINKQFKLYFEYTNLAHKKKSIKKKKGGKVQRAI